MPANAGIQGRRARRLEEGRLSAAWLWIPAFAGMTLRIGLGCIARYGGALVVTACDRERVASGPVLTPKRGGEGAPIREDKALARRPCVGQAVDDGYARGSCLA